MLGVFVLTAPLVVAESQPAERGTLLILGDSLSDAYNLPREAGWAHQLAERLSGRYRVVNASISGDTSAGGLARWPGLIESHSPTHLLLILGGNDGLRALSPAHLESNLQGIIEAALLADISVFLMQIRLPANLGPAYIRRFEAVYPRLAEQDNVLLLPFFLDAIFDQPGMIMDDGIHPTERAQAPMLEALWEHLEPLLD